MDRFQNTYDKLRYNFNTKELAIKNWARHNNSESPKVKKCVEKELLTIKDRSLIEYIYGIDTVCMPYQKEKEKEEIKEKQKGEEKESLAEDEGEEGTSPAYLEEVFEVYEKSMDKLTKFSRGRLVYFAKFMETEVIIAGIEEAGRYNTRSIKYLEAILNNWHSCGIKSMADYRRIKGTPVKQRDRSWEGDLDEFITR
jgi:DnaD/phage-associated family protein